MARPAEDRAAPEAQEQHDELTSENDLYEDLHEDTMELPMGNRRETLTKKTAKKYRIWELEDLNQIQEWDEFDKMAALKIQKNVIKDYEGLVSKYNELKQQVY
jgi:hypothetical protein